MTLDPVQIRVLGALIEKEIATPENYPLSLNALVNACNQRSSRDPVLNLTEEEVRQALRTLEDEDLVAVEHSSRVESTSIAFAPSWTCAATRRRCSASSFCAARRRPASCARVPTASTTSTASTRWKARWHE